jgi:hypothetical protein
VPEGDHIIDKVLLFRDSKSKYVGVKIKAGKDALKGRFTT